MARVNLCFYAKIGLCFLLVSSAFLILMFSQEMRYQELINALKDENMDLRHGLKESDMISIRDKLVKQGLQLMKRDALIFAKESKLLGPADDYGDLVFIKESGKVKRQIDIKEENDINGEKDKPNQDFSDADDNANEQGKPPPLVVDPKYVPDLHDLWFVSNFSIWENYTKDMFTESVEPEPELEKLPGEGGKPIILDRAALPAEDQALWDAGYKSHDYNQYISDKVSLHRNIQDFRLPQCLKKKYRVDRMPDTSVVICFHNEAWTPLLRLVHSVLNRSPPKLLKEIILVDDYSSLEHLHVRLDAYVAQLPKVKLVRTKKREGIIRARIIGGEAASGTVLTYIDSHCECHPGWLEPLLEQLIDRETNVVCPIIGTVDHMTFEILRPLEFFIGGFDWDLVFNWKSMSVRENDRRGGGDKPYRSPTMAGGLFSIYKKYWNYLGTYDSSMEIWGAENMELSYKAWMCGGSIEFVPCSYISHIFRLRVPYSTGKKESGSVIFKHNSLRLAEVWLDEYKDIYHKTINPGIGFGDVSDRLLMRKEKKCKSFQWYLSTIYPEQYVPRLIGQLRSVAFNKCLDADVGHVAPTSLTELIEVKECSTYRITRQIFFISSLHQIRILHRCLDWAPPRVSMQPCHEQGGNQYLDYDEEDLHIRTLTGLCLSIWQDGITIRIADCDPNDPTQKWTGLNRVTNYDQLNMHHTHPEMKFT